jgi:arylsulfatase A-like enzyme
VNPASDESRGRVGGGSLRVADAALFGLAAGLFFGVLETLVLAFKKFALHRYLHVNPQIAWIAPLAYALGFTIIAVLLAIALPKARHLLRLRAVSFTVAALGACGVLFAMGGVHRGALMVLGAGIGVQAMRWTARAWPRLRTWLPVFAGAFALIVAAIGAGLNLAFRLGVDSGAAADDAPNVLWVIWDTVRSDNLSLYGYERATTPALDAFAARGATFDNAISPAPWTLPSHASMFTGLPPHALEAGWRAPLEKQPVTVAEIARASGYRTGGFIANLFYASRESGLSRGFTTWTDYPVFTVPEFLRSTALARAAFNSSLNPLRLFRRAAAAGNDSETVDIATDPLTNGDRGPADVRGTPSSDPAAAAPPRQQTRRASPTRGPVAWIRALQNESRKWAPQVNDEFLDWVTRDDPRPFFAFLNYFDAHDPYRPPAPFDTVFRPGAAPAMIEGQQYSPEEVQRMIGAYDASIAYLDHHFGRLLARLDTLGLLDNTIVIISSDHGEEFGEHRVFTHAHSLYQPSLRVPIVIAAPGVPAGQRIDAWVTATDLARTVLDLAGLEPRDVPGRTLSRYWESLADSAMPPDTLRATVLYSWAVPEYYPIRKGDMESVFADPWKYIRNGDGSEELYDLRADPGEKNDLRGTERGAPLLPSFRNLLPPLAPPQNGR